MIKMNCWDYMHCGREIDGTAVPTKGVCPAWSYWTFQGKNDGFRAGRYCWNVAGTSREGEPMCERASEFGDCKKCDFYRLVKKEEGSGFVA